MPNPSHEQADSAATSAMTRLHAPRARAGGARSQHHRSRIRASAACWCATAASSARAGTSAPARRTPRCMRCARPAAAAAGATAYVTLEPCAHTGRTPPCTAGARSRRSVARVVYARRRSQSAGQRCRRGGVARRGDRGAQPSVLASARRARSIPDSSSACSIGLPWVRVKLGGEPGWPHRARQRREPLDHR